MGKRVVNDNRRGFKGVWIPAEYWLDANLTMSEINMITEIDSQANFNAAMPTNGKPQRPQQPQQPQQPNADDLPF